MFDITQFQAIFPTDGAKPYDQKGIKEIETFRKSFDGTLFIDRVLRALGITEGEDLPESRPPRPRLTDTTILQPRHILPRATTACAASIVTYAKAMALHTTSSPSSTTSCSTMTTSVALAPSSPAPWPKLLPFRTSTSFS